MAHFVSLRIISQLFLRKHKLPDLAIYRIIKNYYQNFFTGNQKEASKIIDFFKDYDLKEIYTVLP